MPQNTRFAAVYSPKYYAETPTASMRKLPIVAERVAKQCGDFFEITEPGPANIVAELRALHGDEYVNAFVNGTKPRCYENGWEWTPEIRDGVLAIHRGQLTAAARALRDGLAANIAQGFHHAGKTGGGGFCTFNGLALVAAAYPHKRIGVLDCDEHEGDGTSEFCAALPNLHQGTVYGTAMLPQSRRERIRSRHTEIQPRDFDTYMASVDMHLDRLFNDIRVDLLQYQAGMDCHEDDPMGCCQLTTAQLYARDRHVFARCRKARVPTLFILAGGYQDDLEHALAPLHTGTFLAARDAWRA